MSDIMRVLQDWECSLPKAAAYLIVAIILSGAIVLLVRLGRIWGWKPTGFIIERSDDPFTFWTQIAGLATIDGIFYLAAWAGATRCSL